MNKDSLHRKRPKELGSKVAPVSKKLRKQGTGNFFKKNNLNTKLDAEHSVIPDEKPKIYNDDELPDEIHIELDDIKLDDPFRLQYDYELSPEILTALSSKPSLWTVNNYKWPVLGNIRFSQPDVSTTKTESSLPSSVMDTTIYASTRNILPHKDDFSFENLFLKSQIVKNLDAANQRFTNKEVTDLQKELFRIVSNYQDVYFTERTFNNGEEIRMVYCCHAVSHALKTRLKITNNNAKISKGKDNDFRDHGLVRPKVLIIVPFRDAALRVVKMIMSVLLGTDGNVMNKKRFLEAFSGDTILMPKRNPRPPDYEQTFYGNTDDNFKIGLALTKKSMKLYADFYSSDIIIASPLGLRMLIGAEGEARRDYDFLSSIEMLILDQAEVFTMQNWDHVLHVMSHMHLVPKDSHGTDLTRVRMWSLNGWSKYYTQNLVFCSHPLPEISALFNSNSKNFAGRAVIANPISNGAIRQIIISVPQIFHEISVDSVVAAVETRFEAFVTKFLPQFRDPLMKSTLIFVPSYFDYVKIRNYFKKQDISFVQICEYSKDGKIARARDLFYHGEVHFMLYSERFHFFRRVRVKGVRHLLFYQPPAFPHFYSEMSNLMKDIKTGKEETGQSDLSITVLYSKYDVTQLAAIVGTERAMRMLASEKSVHMFMTDDS